MDSLCPKERINVYHSDQELLKLLKQRNSAVFERIFNDYYDFLVKFAENYVFNRDVCEDIVQDLFVWLLENSDSLILKTTLRAYLYQATKNRCFDYLKHIKVRDKYGVLNLESELSTLEEDSEMDSNIDKLRDAIDKLPIQMSLIFKAKYYRQLKIEEIAKELNIKESTVKTQLARGKRKLSKTISSFLFCWFF